MYTIFSYYLIVKIKPTYFLKCFIAHISRVKHKELKKSNVGKDFKFRHLHTKNQHK